MNELSIIIVSYNSYAIIEKCLHDLLTDIQFKITIVDNASRDGSAQKLKKTYPNIEVIALQMNIGYGRAANIGLLKANTPYALLLNPDLKVTVAEVNKLRDCVINSPDDTAIWGPASDPANLTDGPRQTTWISGCAMLFDLKKIIQIGLFDENIFLFFEETDLCYRTIKAGYSIMHCGNVVFEHLVSQACLPNLSVDYMKNWHFGWSSAYYYSKHGLAVGKKNLHRRLCNYKIKSWTALSIRKRLMYKANAYGISAFIRGEKAFHEDGTPAASALLEP